MSQSKQLERQNENLEEIKKLLKLISIGIYHFIPKAEKIELDVKKQTKNGVIIEGEDMNLQQGQDAKITVLGIKDSAGKDALIDGALIWSVSGDLSLGELQVSTDGKSALFVRNGNVGECVVEVSADADLTEGQQFIIAQATLTCLAGKATVIEIEAVAQDAAPAPAPVVEEPAPAQ